MAARGVSSFKVDRGGLLEKRQADGFMYFCLVVEPLFHSFPVVQPHISLGSYRFQTHEENWRGFLKCQALLWTRQVEARFDVYGATNFKVLPGNEMSALVSLLKEQLRAECLECRDVEAETHISWTPL